MIQLDRPRILICRLSAVGDCILTLPLLNALRAVWPAAYLAWATEPAAAPLLEDHPSLDRLLIIPKGWLKSPSVVLRLRRQLQELRFDVVLDPQSLTKSSLLGRLAGAPHRVGFAAPRGRELSLWFNNCLVHPTASHLVDAQLQLLQPFAVASPVVRFDLPRNETAERSVEQILATLHLRCPFAAINVGAGWNSRLWPANRYGRVARFLGETHRIPSLVVWAGEREKGWGEEVVASSGGHAVLAPATSLPELLAVLRRARIYVGSDTGPMHLAAAAGTPCVALFGTTRPAESGPYGRGHACVQQRYQEGSSRERRRADNDAMREITCEMVIEACHLTLQRPADDRPFEQPQAA